MIFIIYIKFEFKFIFVVGLWNFFGILLGLILGVSENYLFK